MRTNRTCEIQKPPANEVKFVAVTNAVQSYQANQIGAQVPKHQETLYLEHFALFMRRCQFTRGFASVTADLVHLMQRSASLRHVAIALGALDASRRGSVCSFRGQDSPRYVALNLYGRSIRALQTQVANVALVRCDDLLWSTFLLGLFEVCEENLPVRLRF